VAARSAAIFSNDVVVAIARELNLPIRYIGVGEKLDDLLPFEPDNFIESLFDK